MAYHVGVLRALEEVGGFRPDDADLIVGTSAGSMMGAMLRSGIETSTLWEVARGEHPELTLDRDERRPWAATWASPAEAARRMVGSAYVLQRSLFRFPIPPLPPSLRRLFPGGFFTIADAEDRMGQFWGPTGPNGRCGW